jgi:hypothetical protein
MRLESVRGGVANLLDGPYKAHCAQRPCNSPSLSSSRSRSLLAEVCTSVEAGTGVSPSLSLEDAPEGVRMPGAPEGRERERESGTAPVAGANGKGRERERVSEGDEEEQEEDDERAVAGQYLGDRELGARSWPSGRRTSAVDCRPLGH